MFRIWSQTPLKTLNPTFSIFKGRIGKPVRRPQGFAGVGFSVPHASYYQLVYFYEKY